MAVETYERMAPEELLEALLAYAASQGKDVRLDPPSRPVSRPVATLDDRSPSRPAGDGAPVLMLVATSACATLTCATLVAASLVLPLPATVAGGAGLAAASIGARSRVPGAGGGVIGVALALAVRLTA